MVGENIRQARKRNNMTQKELAKLLGKGISTICEWESGKRSPDVELITELAKVLQTTPAFLLGVDETPAQPHLEQDEQWPQDDLRSKEAHAFTAHEFRLLKAYRNADPIYQSVALELLETHQK